MKKRLDKIERLAKQILVEVHELRDQMRRQPRATRPSRPQDPVPEPRPVPEPQPEPTRPSRPTRPTRPEPGPDGIPASVSGVFDDGTPFSLTFHPSENFPGVHMTEAIRGLCAVAMPSFGGWAVGVLNPFANNGSIGISRLEVVSGSNRTAVSGSIVLHPGWARWQCSPLTSIPDPGTATEAGIANAAKTRARFQFSRHDGLNVTNLRDANEPGGAGIYMENTWAVGCPDGMEVSHYLAEGWANRNAIFRFDRASWSRRRLVPHIFEYDAPYKGIDTTKTFPPQGYEFSKPTSERQGGLNQLDYSHIVRMIHPVEAIAIHGSKFGALLALCLASESKAAMAIENTNDSLMQPWAMYYWSVAGWMRSRERGTGSGLGGRHFNGALRALTAHIWSAHVHYELDAGEFSDPYVRALELCVGAAKYHFDWDKGLFYRLGYATDSGFEPSPQWLHKVRDEQWPHHIPEGETPAVWKGFEHALTFGGLRQAREVLNDLLNRDDAELDRMIKRMADRLGENNPTLGCWENAFWGTHDTATWTNYVLGQDRDEIVSMTINYPADWTGDHPANCFYGDLHN